MEVLVDEAIKGTNTYLHSPDKLTAIEVGIFGIRLFYKLRQVD